MELDLEKFRWKLLWKVAECEGKAIDTVTTQKRVCRWENAEVGGVCRRVKSLSPAIASNYR